LHATVRLFEHAARTLDREDLGARFARDAGLEVLGPFGRAMLRVGTLREAMQVAVGDVDEHNSGARYWIVPDGTFVRLCRRLRLDDTGFRQADLFTVSLMIQLVQRVAGREWRPEQVELQSTGASLEATRYALDLPASCRIADGRSATSIRVPRMLLAQHARGDAPARDDRPDGWDGSAPPAEFAGSVELIVESMLTSSRGLLGATARAAGVDARTLQRHLALAGRSFRDVLERVRSSKATALLDDPNNRMADVAHALGSSDAAHFSRAFRRWTSTTPAEYRRLRDSDVAPGTGEPPAHVATFAAQKAVAGR
jgi:AraC-like DNA-binding protein